MHLRSFVLVSLVAVPGAATAQTWLHRANAPAGAARFGEILAPAGDVDGDQAIDLLVGDPDSARAFVVSGRNGAILRTHVSPHGGDRFGFACAGLGDLDLDGRAEYAIGAPRSALAAGLGVVWVHSGATGAILRTHSASIASTEFGGAISGGADLDGDGWSDYVVGELFYGPPFAPPGRLHWYSGRDGSVLATHDGHNGIGQMGFAVDCVGDVDGDRCDDVLAAEPGFGQAVLYSGRTGAILRVEPWTFGFFFWGSVLGGVGDVNGDGRADYAIGTTDYVGLVRIVSGLDGTTIRESNGSAAGAEFGSATTALGDLDLDGRDDYALGIARDAAGGVGAGRAVVHSGATGAALATITGAAGDQLGTAIARLGDVDGDGWHEIAIGRPGANAIDVYSLRLLGAPAATRLAVHGCPSSTGDLPRLRELGEARLGATTTFRVTGGRPSPVAALNLGVEWNLALGALAPGCLVHAYPLSMLGVPLDANGAIDVAYPLPNDASFAGTVLAWQALTIDPANNPLGIASSNGLATRLGIAPQTIALGTLGSGVRGVDSATGIGYLMHTRESVATRFSASPPPTAAARNLVVVRWNVGTSTWGYAIDSGWIDFTPRATDVLLAELDFSADVATLLVGRFGIVNGIATGCTGTNLVVTPNVYGGAANAGEFGLAGSQFSR